MTVNLTTLSMTTLGIKGLFATFSITTFCHNAETFYAGFHILFFVMLSAVMQIVVTPSAVMQNVVVVSVVVPLSRPIQ
jgi:hypothetical protein